MFNCILMCIQHSVTAILFFTGTSSCCPKRLQGGLAKLLEQDLRINPFTADPAKALHFAMLVSGLGARAPECQKLKMVG